MSDCDDMAKDRPMDNIMAGSSGANSGKDE
jgi:hypothetical protein